MLSKFVTVPAAIAAVLYGIFSLTYFGLPQFHWGNTWQEDWDLYPVARRVWDISDEKLAQLNDVMGAPERLDRSSRRFVSGKRLERPSSSTSFRRDIGLAIEGLPAAVRQLLDEELVGVYVVGNLSDHGSPYISGLALAQFGMFRQHAGTVVLIDRMYSDMGEMELAITMGFRERRPNQETVIRAHVMNSGDNERIVMLQYLLLHEFGHVIDFSRSITPEPEDWPRDVESEACAFACLSWASPDRLANADFLSDIVSYTYDGSRKWDRYLHSAPPLVRALRQSNLESLYSATEPHEDFAESFATYVHTKIMERPWRLDLFIKGDKVDSVESCHLDGRCAQKTAYFDRLFGRHKAADVAQTR